MPSDIYDPEKIKALQPIHEDWQQKIKEFVEHNHGQRKILLNILPCGTGKTTATEEAIFSNKDYQIVWLLDRHLDENDEDNTIGRLKKREVEFIYLKGRDRPGMCFYPEKVKSLSNRYMNINKALCDNCDRNKECEYKRQFEKLRDNPDLPVVGVHHHINTDIVIERFNNSNLPYKLLVFDENPILKMFKKIEIRGDDGKNDLEELARLFVDYDVFRRQNTEIILNIIYALKVLIGLTRSDGIDGISFVKKFIKLLETFNEEKEDISLDEVEIYLDEKSMSNIMRLYKQVLYENDIRCKDILSEVLSIARTCIDIYLNHSGYNNNNLQFWSIKKKNEITPLYDKKIVFGHLCKLPNVPIVITEAKGKKRTYKYAFKCDIEVFNRDTPFEQNITQFMDGMYWKESLQNEDTRYRILNVMLSRIGTKKRIKNKICICTYKNYYEKWFKQHLIEELSKIYDGFDENNISTAHFGNIKGSNSYIGFGAISIIGTPEPDSKEFPLQVGLFFLDEKAINSDRKIEGECEYKGHNYRYEDPRYQAFVDIIRSDVEQFLGRRRAVILKDEILRRTRDDVFSMLPLDVKAKKRKRKDFIAPEKDQATNKLRKAKRDPKYVALSHFEPGDTRSVIYKKVEGVEPFIDNRKLLNLTLDCCIGKYMMEKENKELDWTEGGLRELRGWKEHIANLEGKPKILALGGNY